MNINQKFKGKLYQEQFYSLSIYSVDYRRWAWRRDDMVQVYNLLQEIYYINAIIFYILLQYL